MGFFMADAQSDLPEFRDRVTAAAKMLGVPPTKVRGAVYLQGAGEDWYDLSKMMLALASQIEALEKKTDAQS